MGLSRYFDKPFTLSRYGTPTVDASGQVSKAIVQVAASQGMLYSTEEIRRASGGVLVPVFVTRLLTTDQVAAQAGDFVSCNGVSYTVIRVRPLKRAQELELNEN